MISVPAFLLKRLYVKGSLRNIDHGFQFQLKNTLGSGYGKELMPLTLDGEEQPKENTYLLYEDGAVSFATVCDERPFTLPMNTTLTISVKGVTLSDGPHRIWLGFAVEGLGKLGFEFTDIPTNA